MDPLSLVSGVAGIIAAAAATAQALTTLITEIREAPEDISDLGVELGSLSAILDSARDLCERYNLKDGDLDLVQTLQQCVEHCTVCMQPLRSLLEPFANGERGSGRRSPIRMLTWTMRKGEIRLLKARLRDRKASLTLAASVLNGHLTGKGQDEIRRDMALGYESLVQEFQNVESGRKIRKKLEDDLSSVTIGGRRNSISELTDATFPIRNYMDNYQVPWTSTEPPPIEVLDEYPPVATAYNSRMPPAVADTHQSLLQAVSSGDRRSVLSLLSHGASTTERSPEGLSALHYCALYDDRQLAVDLIDHGANINAKNNERLTSFEMAMRGQSWDVAQLLVERGCAVGNPKTSIFDIVRGADDLSGLRAIMRALVQRRIKAEDGPNLLHRALDNKDSRSLALFLQEGFDPNISEEGLYPLHQALMQGNQKDIELLLQHGADPNAYLAVTVRESLREDSPARKLLDARGRRDYVPLIMANDSSTVFELLLKHGADPNIPLPFIGDGVLLTICAYYEVAQAAVNAGANVNFKDRNHGYSPMFWSTACHNEPLMRLLLDRGADIDIQDHEGTTALIHACSNAHLSCGSKEVKLLLERGADWGKCNKAGISPLQVAEESGRPDVVAMLKEHMQKKREQEQHTRK